MRRSAYLGCCIFDLVFIGIYLWCMARSCSNVGCKLKLAAVPAVALLNWPTTKLSVIFSVDVFCGFLVRINVKLL